MKKYLALVLALILGLTVCGCSFETEGVNGGFVRETYTGIVEEQLTENGSEYIRVVTGNNEGIDFLITSTTEIDGEENISEGDSVEIDCVHWYETSTYEILKLTVTTVQENITFNGIYVYEKDGFGGVFTITLNDDGTFQYSEGGLSSHIGDGTWSFEDGLVCISEESPDGPRNNYFQVEEDCLVFQAKQSNNFIYVKVSDGERFNANES